MTAERVERFVYDDAIVRMFLLATVVWGLVGMLVGLVIALQLVNPAFNFGTPWLSFGRLRPLHTNAVIFAFAGNAIFAGVYYSTQRLLQGAHVERSPEPAPLLGLAGHHRGRRRHAAARAHASPRSTPSSSGRSTSPSRSSGWSSRSTSSGRSRGGASGTSTSRSGSTSPPSSPSRCCTSSTTSSWWRGRFKSYSIYAGVQDAFMQWWYGHNAVAFFLTTPFLGHDVLLPAQGGGAAGLLLPALDPALLDAGLHLHLGRAAPPALHRAARRGPRRSACSSR